MANESRSLFKSQSRWPTVAIALTYTGLLYLLWSLAWLLERWLEHRFALLRSGGAQFTYWLVMKLLLWVLPAILIIRLSGRRLQEVLGLKRLVPIAVWGGGVGLLLALTGFGLKYASGKALLPASFGWPHVNALLVAPAGGGANFSGRNSRLTKAALPVCGR